MKEAEFTALLAIEGKELHIEGSYFRVPFWGAKMKHHTRAEIREAGEIILSTNWVQRRYYAVQSLIKRYYGDRG